MRPMDMKGANGQSELTRAEEDGGMYHLKTASWRSAVDMMDVREMDVRIKTSLLLLGGRPRLDAAGAIGGTAMVTREVVTVVDVRPGGARASGGGVEDDEGRGREGISRWREMP